VRPLFEALVPADDSVLRVVVLGVDLMEVRHGVDSIDLVLSWSKFLHEGVRTEP
jgi:hypothetical protein